jgi:KUP system potassium uptake protein
MFVTTTLLACVWYFVWGFIWIIPIGFLLTFGTLDGVFWAGISFTCQISPLATLRKFATGAWFPFMVGVIMTAFMMFWRWGMNKKRSYEMNRRVRLSELLRRESELPAISGEGAFKLGDNRELVNANPEMSNVKDEKQPIDDSKPSTSKDSMAINAARSSDQSNTSEIPRRSNQQLYLRASDLPVYRLPGISIFYTSAPTSHSHAPHTFRHFLEHFPALHSTCIFLHVRTAAQPHVNNDEKLVLEASPLWEGIWRGVYRVGYMEIPDFSSADFTVRLFEKMGRRVEGLTHVLQYTKLVAHREKEARGERWWKRLPESIRGWFIDVLWSGVDEVIGGVGKGWKVPVGEVVSVGAVAEV